MPKKRPLDMHVPRPSVAPPGFVSVKAWSYTAPRVQIGCIVCRDPVGVRCCEFGRDR
jgi:hypothetical protein